MMRNPLRWFAKTFPLSKRGQNGPDDWPSVRPTPPPAMYPGSVFPRFDINVPMPKGARNPRVNP